eukprot:CAMPEP_0181455202 /NCGR_PEP_ID=MMETSP1110-20121109/30637_1 /TAXON_ID=174948 /ORGANISM="Symbiodinium sp., Strain CCMP421" /LENGTH=168 /DNA_ID=CAMNT_0023579581 /DNA_START=43 /DNA_END=549 /DNA_ORIENTATION=+
MALCMADDVPLGAFHVDIRRDDLFSQLHPKHQAGIAHVQEDDGIDALKDHAHPAHRAGAHSSSHRKDGAARPEHHQDAPEEQDGWAFTAGDDAAEAPFFSDHTKPAEVCEKVGKNDLHAASPADRDPVMVLIRESVDACHDDGHDDCDIELKHTPLSERSAPVTRLAR